MLDWRGYAWQEIWGVKRGLGVAVGDVEIVGEGMGIGGVVALRGDTYFALDSEDLNDDGRIERRLLLNGSLEKYIGNVKIDRLYKPIWTSLSPLYVSSSFFRPLFKYLMYARNLLIRTVPKRRVPIGHVELSYRPKEDGVDVKARWSLDGQVIIANELSGRLFDELRVDGSRVKLGPWIELRGSEAELRSRRLRLSMIIERVKNAALFCGREVIGRRLDWAGFSYIPTLGTRNLEYSVRFVRND